LEQVAHLAQLAAQEMLATIPYLAPLLQLAVVAAVAVHLRQQMLETADLVAVVVEYLAPAAQEIRPAPPHRKEIMAALAVETLTRAQAGAAARLLRVLLEMAQLALAEMAVMAPHHQLVAAALPMPVVAAVAD
jgi:hypothetical protein